MNDVATPMPTGAPIPTVAKNSAANYVAGRRACFKYRDLWVTAATGGRLRAQVTSAEAGMSQPTGWHPGNTPHNEIRTADTFELLEISLPAKMETEPCDAPRQADIGKADMRQASAR